MIILLSAVLAAFAAGCSCSPEEEYKLELPVEPEGLEIVAKEDVKDVLDGFLARNEFSETGENAYLNYYAYSGNAQDSREAEQVLLEAKTYIGSVAYGDLVVKCDDKAEINGSTTIISHDPQTVKLRGEQCYKVSDGRTTYVNDKLSSRGSGVTGAYSGGYRDGLSVLDYLLFRYDNLSLEELLKEAADDTATVKADDSRLFISADYTAGGENKRVLLLFDVEADNGAFFDGGTPSAAQIQNVLYFTADNRDFMRDFLDNKEIKITAQGGGDKSKLMLNDASLVVNYRYDNKGGNTNLNIGFSDGEIWFSEDSFYTLCNKMGSGAFEIDKLMMFSFEITANFQAERTVNGVREEYDCETILLLDY